jgi:hypothetical protein
VFAYLSAAIAINIYSENIDALVPMGFNQKKHIDNMQITIAILYAFNSDGNCCRKVCKHRYLN